LKNKGQALVEFVLILPVLLLLLFAFFDVSRIFIGKNHLENVMNEVSKLVIANKTEEEISDYLKKDDYQISISMSKNKYINIKLKTSLDLITPGLKQILNDPYIIEVERSIIHE